MKQKKFRQKKEQVTDIKRIGGKYRDVLVKTCEGVCEIVRLFERGFD